ncbi:unnamed protein product [Rotaria socialis]|uniref:Uncharacterized protein n=1 Tax=Rotaria socialis TaxID=392032 RepID=A0A821BGQ1_9BILA|nr:unnamed protein product [Rotaria socialis]
MAVPFSFIILSSVVFLALQHVATGLRCYSCDPCDAVNNSMPTTSSNGTEYSCWKTIRLIATGVTHTSRGIRTNCQEENSVFAGTALQHVATGLRCYSCDPCDVVNNNTLITSSNGAGYSCWKTITLAASVVTHTRRGILANCKEENSVFAGTVLQHAAIGLVCYSCDGCGNVNNSTTIATGIETLGYSCWKTITLAVPLVTYAQRGIISNCQEQNSVIAGAGVRTACCSTDRCNSGAPLPSSTGLILFLIMSGSLSKCILIH